MGIRAAVVLWLVLEGGPGCGAAPVPRGAVADADGDGIADDVDRCPHDPEDYDGYLDDDGCPDADESGHLIEDVDDRCPIVRDCDDEFIDDDGCPDVILAFGRDSVALSEKHIELIGELADELATRKRVVRLRIDGHAAAGEAGALGARRAEVVRERLVARGVADAMLSTRADGAPEGSSGFVSFFALECAD